MARYLERAGYQTRVAADGIEAIEAASRHRPDLVVLDLMLPRLDGLEVMRRLREQDRERIAVILLTAKGEESDRVIGLRLGADDYVVKVLASEARRPRVVRINAHGSCGFQFNASGLTCGISDSRRRRGSVPRPAAR